MIEGLGPWGQALCESKRPLLKFTAGAWRHLPMKTGTVTSAGFA